MRIHKASPPGKKEEVLEVDKLPIQKVKIPARLEMEAAKTLDDLTSTNNGILLGRTLIPAKTTTIPADEWSP